MRDTLAVAKEVTINFDQCYGNSETNKQLTQMRRYRRRVIPLNEAS